MKLPNQLPSPEGLREDEILEILLREEYGYLPARATSVKAEVVGKINTKFCAGKADLVTLSINCTAPWGSFSFPAYYVCPKQANGPVPCFVHINFRDNIPDQYQPTEELVDEGVATLTFCYKDVTSDDGDFTNGLAGVIYPNGERGEYDCGKIGLWAWAACSLLDYALTLPELDPTRIYVVGHSRLGKTALLAGALDARFACAISNDSGCSGAALSRENTGETIEVITRVFPYWFCKHYCNYANNENALPFDQHFLLAANVAHKVYVASAAGDAWACPKNEYLSCVAANEYFQARGKHGFVYPDRLPEIGECFHSGDIGYHLRAGQHYLSREDWKYYLKYLLKNG